MNESMEAEVGDPSAPNGPPTYEEATHLPRGPSTRESTPLIGHRRHADRPRPRRNTEDRRPRTDVEDEYSVQGVVRFWLGLSFEEPQSNTCSGYASLLCRFVFVLLFIWGAIIIVLTVLKGGGQHFYNACSEFFTVVILTYLGGLSFVLCFLYCVCVHFWECCGSRERRNRRHQRNFTICGALACLLSLFFIAVLGGLATWIGEHSDYVIYGCNSDDADASSSESVLCSCQRKSAEIDSPFYMLPLWTAGSMAAITFVCGFVNCVGCCVAACRSRQHR